MKKGPLPAAYTRPGRDPNGDLAGLTTDELAVTVAGCDFLIGQLWQRARQDHAEIDRLYARQQEAFRLLGKARRHAEGQAGILGPVSASEGSLTE